MNWFELSVKVGANESVPVSLPTIYYHILRFRMQGTEAIKLLLDCQRAEIKRWHTVKTVPTASTEKPVYSKYGAPEQGTSKGTVQRV